MENHQGFLSSKTPISELRQYFFAKTCFKIRGYVSTSHSAGFLAPRAPEKIRYKKKVRHPSLRISNIHPHILAIDQTSHSFSIQIVILHQSPNSRSSHLYHQRSPFG